MHLLLISTRARVCSAPHARRQNNLFQHAHMHMNVSGRSQGPYCALAWCTPRAAAARALANAIHLPLLLPVLLLELGAQSWETLQE